MLPPVGPAHFSSQFASERARLISALGLVTAGGLIENIRHLGSTTHTGAAGSGVVDIALSICPYPLLPDALAALRRLGYRPGRPLPAQPRGAAPPASPVQRFTHTRRPVQLWCFEAGGDAWQDHLTVSEYLAHLDRPAPRGRARNYQKLLPRAEAWWAARYGFAPVEDLAAELAGFDRPWHISSGWALDLFLGQVGRVHHDIDVEVARPDQLALRAHLEARGWRFATPYNQRLEPWPPDMRLEGERHQAHAHRGEAFIDCLFSDVTSELWRYRRQPQIIRLAERAELRTPAGVPYLAPELVLLFKSKNTSARPRRQDRLDFERAAPRLDAERRAWLRWALAAADPGHPWIERLS